MRMTSLEENNFMSSFLNDAIRCFEDNPEKYTYTETEIKAGCLFALRFGLSDDCVVIFQLDEDFEPINFQKAVKPRIKPGIVGFADGVVI